MSSFMSKKDKKKLIQLINNTRLNNENDIWDLAVELENMSVRLRAEVLRRHEFDE
jgi:hypothetical protein